MTKIHDNIYEKITYTIELSSVSEPINKLADYIEQLPNHPNILNPTNVTCDAKNTVYLHYSVFANGTTLRSWINSINSIKQGFRTTIRKTLHLSPMKLKINPLDIMMQLIEACEFMLSKNMLVGQSSIDPDFIWIEYDESQKLHVRILNTIEASSTDILDSIHKNKVYWSPEMISKYNHKMFYSDNEIQIPQCVMNYKSAREFKRYDTRPSTLSSVYSLGLILYYITMNEDPFVGHRVCADERPLRMYEINMNVSKLVWSATEQDIKMRPTLQEWKKQIVAAATNYNKKYSCVLL